MTRRIRIDHDASMWRRAAMAALVASAAWGCSSGEAEEVGSTNPPAEQISFDEFLATVHLDETGKYVYDGDTPARDLDDLRAAWEQLYPRRGALTVNRTAAGDDLWQGGTQLGLSYCISNNFGARKQQVIDAMAAAGAAWSGSAVVNFVYVPSQDASCTNANTSVVFNVNAVSGQPYIAAAFFPSWARSQRTLNIDASAYTSGFPLAGILMHELGHALGFRHEFVRVGSCQAEPANWRGVTPYDVGSIMHYPFPSCGGTNPFTGLSTSDREGVTQLYDSRLIGNPAPPTACGIVRAGQGLGRNRGITSCDGRFLLVHQGDGNLVLYQGGAALWHTNTFGQPGYGTYMQGDGNLVIYSGLGRAIWHTNTWGNPGAFLAVQNDGNVVIYTAQGRAIWQSQTCCR